MAFLTPTRPGQKCVDQWQECTRDPLLCLQLQVLSGQSLACRSGTQPAVSVSIKALASRGKGPCCFARLVPLCSAVARPPATYENSYQSNLRRLKAALNGLTHHRRAFFRPQLGAALSVRAAAAGASPADTQSGDMVQAKNSLGPMLSPSAVNKSWVCSSLAA